MNDNTDLEDEALEWVVRLTSGTSTTADHVAFRAWRDRGADHAAALARARNLYVHLGRALPKVSESPMPHLLPGSGPISPRRGVPDFRQIARPLALAASIALVVLTSYQFLSVWRYDHVTGRGEIRSIALADGSEVRMGPDTAVNVDYDGGDRSVELARGEALFRVRHDAARPFTVKAGDAIVRDVGTVFDIDSSATGTTVVVAEGAVDVSVGRNRSRLTANQMTRSANGRLASVQYVDAGDALAWTKRRLVVENQPLAIVVDKLRPFYPGRIVLLRSGDPRERFSAVIDLNRIDDWFQALSRTRDVDVSHVAGITVLH